MSKTLGDTLTELMTLTGDEKKMAQGDLMAYKAMLDYKESLLDKKLKPKGTRLGQWLPVKTEREESQLRTILDRQRIVVKLKDAALKGQNTLPHYWITMRDYRHVMYLRKQGVTHSGNLLYWNWQPTKEGAMEHRKEQAK